MQQYYDDKREAERLIEEAKKPRKPHPLLCGTHHCIVAGLKVHLEHQKGLFFCKDCPHPALEGSWIDVWESHYNPHDYSVGGALVFAVPNDGSSEVMTDIQRPKILFVDGKPAYLINGAGKQSMWTDSFTLFRAIQQ